jgi:membrane-bound lytic murein transglycosylase A
VDPLKGQQKDQKQKEHNNAAKAPEVSAAAASTDTGEDIAKEAPKAAESVKNPEPAAAQPPPPAVVAQASTPVAAVKPVPLPEARPSIKPVRDMRRHRRDRDGQYLRVR